MPISEAEALGPTATARKRKADETGFIESALAGVATGVINIPKGFLSLGAELVDLGLGTETASSVEKFSTILILLTMKQKQEPSVESHKP